MAVSPTRRESQRKGAQPLLRLISAMAQVQQKPRSNVDVACMHAYWQCCSSQKLLIANAAQAEIEDFELYDLRS